MRYSRTGVNDYSVKLTDEDIEHYNLSSVFNGDGISSTARMFDLFNDMGLSVRGGVRCDLAYGVSEDGEKSLHIHFISGEEGNEIAVERLNDIARTLDDDKGLSTEKLNEFRDILSEQLNRAVSLRQQLRAATDCENDEEDTGRDARLGAAFTSVESSILAIISLIERVDVLLSSMDRGYEVLVRTVDSDRELIEVMGRLEKFKMQYRVYRCGESWIVMFRYYKESKQIMLVAEQFPGFYSATNRDVAITAEHGRLVYDRFE